MLYKKLLFRIIWKISHLSKFLRYMMKPIGLRSNKANHENQCTKLFLPQKKKVYLREPDQNYLTFELNWKGWTYYEPTTLLVIKELLNDDSVFIDIGANIGFFSILVKMFKPDVNVFAFEPHPKLFHLLQSNIQKNQLTLISEPLAISDEVTLATFYIHASDMSSSLEKSFRNEHLDTVDVQTVSLDHYFKSTNLSNSLIKIDVEGHEAAVLKGAETILRKYHPDIILEVILPYDEQFVAYLKELGYCFYNITNKGFIPKNTLIPDRSKKYFFQNYFITTKVDSEVHAVFSQIQQEIQMINFDLTSNYKYK